MSLKLCVLASGSSGNATWIATARTHLLVDAGLPASEITQRLRDIGSDIRKLDGILLTHAHADHCRSAGTLNHRHDIPVFAPQATFTAIEQQLRKGRHRRVRSPKDIPSAIGDLTIEVFPTQHGDPSKAAGETLGFVLRLGNSAAAIATDLGKPTEAVRNALTHAQILVLEANYDEAILARKLGDPAFREDWEYLEWVRSDYGHLSNRQCADLLASVIPAGVATDVFLAHLSENHHDARRDNNRYELAREAVLARLSESSLPPPRLHRTYRRGLTRGQPSAVVEIPDGADPSRT